MHSGGYSSSLIAVRKCIKSIFALINRFTFCKPVFPPNFLHFVFNTQIIRGIKTNKKDVELEPLNCFYLGKNLIFFKINVVKQ